MKAGKMLRNATLHAASFHKKGEKGADSGITENSNKTAPENAVRCDAQRSTLQQPMQHAARANAPHCMTEVKSVPAGSEK